MRLVIALGGNALLRRGQPLTSENQLNNVKKAAAGIAQLAKSHEIIITHGNGPQIGLLALQGQAYKSEEAFPLDILGAETEGMIGYLLEQEIANFLPNRCVTTLLTRVEVDREDPAFLHPSKPIGPVYSKETALAIAQEKKWTMAADNSGYRRVVASPQPRRIIGIESIMHLLQYQTIVIAGGGGGIPVARNEDQSTYRGVEAVIDKDLSSALLAAQVAADILLIVTDVDAVYLDWGKASQKPINKISASELRQLNFAAGSMSPKVKAACQFAESTHKIAVIGSLEQMPCMLDENVGTRVLQV